MNFTKGTLTVALTALLTACGGGGSDGYYNNSNAGVNTQPPAGQNPPTTAAEAQKTFNALKTEAASLFGRRFKSQVQHICN